MKRTLSILLALLAALSLFTFGSAPTAEAKTEKLTLSDLAELDADTKLTLEQVLPLLQEAYALGYEDGQKAVGSVLQQHPRILPADGELGRGVAEAALPRPDHGHDGHAGLPLCHKQGADRRREAAVEEVAVELHAVRPGTPGLDHVVGATAAHLDFYPFFIRHGESLLVRRVILSFAISSL